MSTSLVSTLLTPHVLGYYVGLPALCLLAAHRVIRNWNRSACRQRFRDCNVIITGASSGIGRQLAIKCAQFGAKNIVITGQREEALLETKRQCQSVCESHADGVLMVHIFRMDVSVEEDCKRLIEVAVHDFFSSETEKIGRIDYLFLNAGVDSVVRFSKAQDLSFHQRVMDVNYFGCVMPTFYALPYIRNQERNAHGLHGSIVVTSSLAGKFGCLFRTAYSASKHALHGFFDSLRIELADTKTRIHISMLCPGFIATSLHAEGRALGSKMERDLSKFDGVEESVDEMLEAVAKQEFEHVMTFSGRLGVAVRGISPLFLVDFFRGEFERATTPADETR